MRREPEADLIQQALEAFQKATGLRVELERQEYVQAHGLTFDAVVRLWAAGDRKEFLVEAKRNLTTATLGIVLHRLRAYDAQERVLLATDYINPRMAERLREAGVCFIDTVGNAYLDAPPIFVLTTGNKPERKPTGYRQTRAFQATGLRVVFAFLCKPELVRVPYRQIAEAARVAVGTVGWVITDLKEAGLLVGRGTGARRLLDRAELLRRWAMAYPEKLRTKQVIGRYTARERHWWKHARLEEFPAYWGGEVAAAKLTQYLEPELVTVYARRNHARLQVKHRLREDPKGEVEILKAFWNPEYDWRVPEIVHPILTYADLLATAEPRNLETANMLYEQEIVGLIKQD